MKIIVNSISQSDYGVGNTDTIYTLNLSLPYITKFPSLQVVIPN